MTIDRPKRRRVRRATPVSDSAQRLKALAYAARIAERDRQLALAGVIVTYDDASGSSKPSK